MKKLLLLILVLLPFLKVSAQSMQLEIDQLRQQLKDHTQTDTLRVNRIIELARKPNISNSEFDSLSGEALNISQKIQYPYGLGSAMLMRALILFRKGDIAQASALVNKSNDIATKTGDQKLLTYVLLGMSTLKSQSDNIQSVNYAIKADSVAALIGNKKLQAVCQRTVANIYSNSIADYAKAMEWILKAAQSAEDADCQSCLAASWQTEAGIYTGMGDQKSSLVYYEKALEANKKVGNKALENLLYNNIGERYRLMGKYPEAIQAYKQALAGEPNHRSTGVNESNLADVYVRINNLPLAFKYAFSSLKTSQETNDIETESWIDYILSRAYLKQNKTDSALYYANHGLAIAKRVSALEFIRDNYEALADAYAKLKDFKSAFTNRSLYIVYRDSMVSTQVTNKSNLLQYNYNLQKKLAQITSLNQQQKLQYYFLAGALGIVVLIGLTVIILLRNNRQKQKANNLLSEQKKLIENQRDKTNKALTDLQATQSQLVQREKLASLGELTAGIAHEIQNPLNFVNNFSELNREMIGELKSELQSGNLPGALTIAEDIDQNEQKINHHGRRADSIVKGMLQHSRATSNIKEPTDVNKLADEYLRLAYHGLRAKNKSFNAELVTHFAEGLPQVNMVPQDVGRVLLNLFNNSFYAVQKKQETAGPDFKPAVELTTAIKGGNLLIMVKDNGDGIPDAIRDKIMQPFFTTKPTGEGTGLGLSLSYDTVVKGHNGTIDILTREGEFTEFTITLPILN